VDETTSEKEIALSVMQELRGRVYDGITTCELCRVLKEYFGVVAVYYCDLIQRMKIELDMHCPDKQHLYFV
jgi:transposase